MKINLKNSVFLLFMMASLVLSIQLWPKTVMADEPEIITHTSYGALYPYFQSIDTIVVNINSSGVEEKNFGLIDKDGTRENDVQHLIYDEIKAAFSPFENVKVLSPVYDRGDNSQPYKANCSLSLNIYLTSKIFLVNKTREIETATLSLTLSRKNWEIPFPHFHSYQFLVPDDSTKTAEELKKSTNILVSQLPYAWARVNKWEESPCRKNKEKLDE